MNRLGPYGDAGHVDAACAAAAEAFRSIATTSEQRAQFH
jgi:NADP-dependent aldehyde dehydrogenase